MPMPARKKIVYMAHLHNEWRKDNNPPVLNAQTVSQKRKANKVDYMIYRSMMKAVEKENYSLKHWFILPRSGRYCLAFSDIAESSLALFF